MLGVVVDWQLSREPQVRAWFLAVKYATRRRQQLEIKEFLIEVLSDAPEDFHFIMRYVVETYGSYDEQTVREIIRRVQPEEEEKMMSQFAQDIIAKSKPEWLRKGRQEEAAAMLIKLMRRKFDQVPELTIEKVQSAKLELIEIWSDNFVFADSLEDVFAS